MIVKRFLSYVEIKTKITSVFAFMMTLAYLFYKGQRIDPLKTSVFFVGMFFFDLTTTAINNYIDTKTNDQVLQFQRRNALIIIYVLFGISTVAGLYLAYLTDVVVFLLGGICFLAGIFYTYGPVPISRQPLGEIMSGIFYGLFIPFILLYINMPEGTYLSLRYDKGIIGVEFAVMPLLAVFLLSITPMCATANIMLANNICDVEKDVAVRRHTLPYYIGKKPALYLFAILYYIAYASIVIMVVIGILPPFCLLALATVPIVQRNISSFMKHQDKATTFLAAIKNYIIIMGSFTALIFIRGLL